MESGMNEIFRSFGLGFCGSVWAAPIGFEDACAMKREDGGPGRSLYNDYIMHQKILEGFSVNEPRIRVPGCHQHVYGGDRTG